MTTGGWIFLILAWGSILTLSSYCIIKVLINEGKTED